MAIDTTDIKFRLSGGAANSAPGTSLGGVKSSVDVNPSTLFDIVDAGESSAGDSEYRCLYVHNGHATLTLTGAVLWIPANTANVGTDINVGLGSSALNGTEQNVANENTAPADVTFTAAATQGAGIVLGDIPPGQHRAVWVRRVVQAGAAASNDTFTLAAVGATAA